MLVSVATGKDYQHRREALAALGVLPDAAKENRGADETVDQMRAKARALAALKRRPDRKAAVQILERMRDRQPLLAEDQFILAVLYESLGDWAKARDEMFTLVSKDGKNPLYLRQLALSLLRHEEPDAAAPLVAKLAELYPNALATVEIKARLLNAQKKGSEAAS